MAATPSIRVTKSFPYRGGAREWSNRYHFLGGVPGSPAQWDAFFDAVVNLEKACHFATTTIVQAEGYAAGSDRPLASKIYTTAGTHTLGGPDAYCPGEACILAIYSTSSFSVRNHPVYLYNYFHGVSASNSPASIDTPATDQATLFANYVHQWMLGISGGGITATRCGPNGQIVTDVGIEPWLSHRDFPRARS